MYHQEEFLHLGIVSLFFMLQILENITKLLEAEAEESVIFLRHVFEGQ